MMTTRTPGLWLVAVLFLLAVGCDATSNEWGCEADAKSLCAGEENRARQVKCLGARRAELSETCNETIENEIASAKARIYQRALGIVCMDDVEKYCSKIAAYADRETVANCLDEHRHDIAPLCNRKIRNKLHVRLGRDFEIACKSEVLTYCSDVPRTARPDDVRACLNESRDEISDFCRDMIDGKILSKRKQQEKDRREARLRKNAAMGQNPDTPEEYSPHEAEL